MARLMRSLSALIVFVCVLHAHGQAVAQVSNVTTATEYLSIQAAVSAANAGDVIEITPGTYAENVVSTVPLTLQGSDPGVVIAPTGGTAVSLAAGSSETVRSILRDLTVSGVAGSITGIVAGSYTTIEDVVSRGHSNYGINLNPGTDLIITDSHFDENTVGLKLSSTASFTGIVISGSSFDDNESHGWYSDASKSIMPVLDDVTITNTSFIGNVIKGFYTERLSNALFDNITVADNGNDPGYNFGAGMDINLKWRSDYVSITIQDSSFTNNGNGSLHGVALTIKARDDAPTYNDPAAALSGVLIIRTAFDDNERHYVAGEPGKVNTGPTGVVIEESTFGEATSGSVVNHSSAAIDANYNFWGDSAGPGTSVDGDVAAAIYYTDAGLSNVFSPVTNVTESTYFATIQAAINAATAGDEIEVSAGTFVEDILINKAISLTGSGAGATIVSGPIGGTGNTIQIASSNVSVSGFTITREGNDLASWNNPALNAAGIGLQSAIITGVVVHDNLISGMRTGIDINNTNSVTIRNNIITNNRTGLILRNKTDDLLVEENEITGNWTVGIVFLDASSGSNSPLQQAVGSVFSNNNISGNWYGQIVDRQTGGSLPAAGANLKDFTGNWLGSVVPVVSIANSAEPGYADQIPVVFGGTAEAPPAGSQPDIVGSASANLSFVPLLASGNDTDVETVPGRGVYGFQGDQGAVDAPVKITTVPASPVLFPTLAAALAAAVPGDIIELSPGSHTGPALNINKAVTLLGANAGLAGTDPARVAESQIFNMKLTITVAGVVIDGVEIYQTNDTADAVLVSSGATVKNSVLRRFGISTGISARAITTAVGVIGYAFENNLFSGDSSGGLFGGHKTWNSGLYLNGGSGSITGNTFEICRSAINADDFNAGITITGNTFRANGTYLSFGGTTPTDGSYTIAGNDFGFDFNVPPGSNPTLFNTSNVAPSFRLNVINNLYGGTASADLTASQKFSLETRNFHRGRSGRNGVVDFVAGEQIVVPGTTIQSAIDAAAEGETVLVSAGTHPGPVILNKNNLNLLGVSEAGVRPEISVAGSTSSLGTVVFAPASSGVSISGFKIVGIDGTPGLEKSAVYLQGSQTDVTIVDNEMVAAGDAALMAEYGLSVTGIVIRDNLFSGSTFNGPWSGGPGGGGQFVEPNWPRALVYFGGPAGGSNKTGIVFEDNVIDAISGDANNSNVMVNLDGAGVEISGNQFGGNTGSRPGVPLLRARGVTTDVSENVFTGTSALAVFIGNGASNSVSENNFHGSYTPGILNAGTDSLDSRYNYWGVSNPDFNALVAGTVVFSPWYADAARTLLVTETNFEDFTVAPGETVSFDDLLVGSGTTWTIGGTLEVTGQFVLEDGAILEVVDGDITFADGTTMSGTFTFFNSFGSVNFDDDVAIAGSAEGLILVSDVHVADGVTITVDGTFTIDGCTVDSDGTFDLIVNGGADFTMARTSFSDGDIIVNSDLTEIYDNHFTDMNLDVMAPTNGARIFHNILSATADIDDFGTGTVTVVDAWGNVTDTANTENNLPLTLELAPALITGNRSIDAEGVAYIQPGDAVSAAFSVSELQNKIIGVELLLGYNTDLLGAASLGLGTNWDDFTIESDATNVIGRFNAALVVDVNFPDPSGTDAPQTVGDLGLVAGSDEGVTQVFHRVKFAGETVEATRLSKGLPGAGYLTPFTSNSPMIVIDETAPAIAPTGITIEQAGDDMTQFITLQGILEVSASAFDGLAGIDDVDAVVTLVGPTTYTATQVLVTNPGPTIGADVYTTYGFEYEVTSTTLNGDYDVVLTVVDRSGNETSSVLGEITINKNQITATVELEGLVAGPVSRNVTFVFTDNNAMVDTRTESVIFTNGVGTVTFTDVVGETDQLSAKTSTHLRDRVPVVFTDGQASVTYPDALPGGDLNGDNVINLLDYAVLKFYWLNVVGTVPAAASAEITGDGSVNLTDYQILQSNFYLQGDPQ